MSRFAIELNTEATDTITGYTGKVTGRVEYLTGCIQYLLSARVKEDGAYVDGRWFDEGRLTGDYENAPNGGDILPSAK